MKSYNEFIKESIRDKMTGPDIDPKKILYDKNLTYNQKLSTIGENNLTDFFSEEEIDELKNKAAQEIIRDVEHGIEKGEYETIIPFITMSADYKEIMEVLSDDGKDTMEILYLYFYPDYSRKQLSKRHDKVVKQLIQLMIKNIDVLAENLALMYDL